MVWGLTQRSLWPPDVPTLAQTAILSSFYVRLPGHRAMGMAEETQYPNFFASSSACLTMRSIRFRPFCQNFALFMLKPMFFIRFFG